jgi:uncharacterized alpha-E superfamily protein
LLLSKGENFVLSRIAENLYWLGRYIERAENIARLLNVNSLALMEAPLVPGAPGIVTEQWAPLISFSDNEELFKQYFDKPNSQNVATWLALSYENPSSIRSSLALARENARTLRDRISTEMWEYINVTYHKLCEEAPHTLDEDNLYDYCILARDFSHLFFGMAEATLTHDLGWYFIKAGRHLERADNTLRALRIRYKHYRGQTAPVTEGLEAHRGMAMLKSLSAYEAFRKYYHTALEPKLIAEFLLLHGQFPRSVRYNVRRLFEATNDLSKYNPDTPSEAKRMTGWLFSRLEYMSEVEQIIEKEKPSLDDLIDALSDISNMISKTYFNYSETTSTQTQQH